VLDTLALGMIVPAPEIRPGWTGMTAQQGDATSA
jgi:hypothetical protein